MKAVMAFEQANARICRSADELNRTLGEMARLLPEMIDDVIRNMVEQLYLTLVGAGAVPTPIKTGRARTGWVVGTMETDWCPPDMTKNPKSAGEIMDAARAAVAALPRSSVYYLYNNVPYIMKLEQGWSNQAPHGFVALALAQFAVALEQQVKTWGMAA